MANKDKPIRHNVTTEDNWEISVFQYPGDSKKTNFPVFLVHGLASNHYNLDFPDSKINLAQFLNDQGFDTWIIDLRGAGASKSRDPYQKDWSFDDYVFHDVPAAIKKMLDTTEKRKFHWIGHSLGGVIAYAYIHHINHNALKSLTAIASPITTKRKIGYIKYTFQMDTLLKYIPIMPYRVFSKIGEMLPHLLLKAPLDTIISKENMTPKLLKKLLHYGIENIPSRLVLQIHDWFRHGHFRSEDQKRDYTDLKKFTMPFLMIHGNKDSFTHIKDVKRIMKFLPSPNFKILSFGKEFGHCVDYSHIDLVLGVHSKKEVYPEIAKWISEND